MVILQNTLFSAIVASFILETYGLSDDSGQKAPDGRSSMVVRVNIALFLSFFLSMMSAVGCALIQQWCYEYLKFAYPRGAPHECGRVRTYLFQGLNVFQIRRFMYGIHVLLHISFFLFFGAISGFFYDVNHHLGTVACSALVASIIFYMLLSISPLISSNSPYNTPMTPPLRAGAIILRITIRFPLWCFQRIRGQPFELIGLEYYKGIHFKKTQFFLAEAEMRAEMLEPYAMKWLFTKDDFSDRDMDKFLEGLPGYISSTHTQMDHLDGYLTADHILRRIKHHFMTCATSVELSDETIINRVSLSVEALRLIFQQSLKPNQGSSVPDKLEEKLQLQQAYLQGLLDDFQTFCGVDDPGIALRASCVRGLAAQGLLSRLVQSYEYEKGTIPSRQFPISLIPLYKFFFPNDNADIVQRLSDGDAPSTLENSKMWKSFMQDGPLANLTMLSQAVLSEKRAVFTGEQTVFSGEQAPSSTLSFCWTTLDILLMQLGTIHTEGLTCAQSDFDNLRAKIRMYVRVEEQGFRVTQLAPLREILNIVSRGRRLLMVFSDYPEYQNRADMVFGKEYLQNSVLLEAFAHCLPVFIAKHSPELGRNFVEDVVNCDGLWTILLTALSNNKWSDSPDSHKLRVFENCSTVIDVVFATLEDSPRMDWQAPELGLLLQHLEFFMTYCFRGALLGRAISFQVRVGIIKARFCKASLAQLRDEIDRDGPICLRSRWDFASLARLISTLGLWDEEDAKLRNPYINRGCIGVNFTTTILEMIDIITRDGPLVIFCQLVHLVAMAAPLDQCRLGLMDIEGVWELQRKLVEDQRLPLYLASDTVWRELGRLRRHVLNLCGRSICGDRETLQRLLGTIDDICSLRVSVSMVPDQREPAEEGGHNPQDVAKSMAISEVSHGFSNRFSFASESNAAIGRLSTVTQSSEREDDASRKTYLSISRAFIDCCPVRSTDKCLDRKKKAERRSESPQSCDAGVYDLPSRWITDHTGGIFPSDISPVVRHFPSMADVSLIHLSPWIMNRSIGIPLQSILPVYPYFLHVVDASQRHTYSYTRRAGSGLSGTRPSILIRASSATGVIFRSRGDAPIALPNPVTSLMYGSFGLSDEI